MNKFTHFSGNKDCKKCHGEGSYMYDDTHGKICEVCCDHPRGAWSFERGDKNEHLNGYCIFGCGKLLV